MEEFFQKNFIIEYRPYIFTGFIGLFIIELIWIWRTKAPHFSIKETLSNAFMYGSMQASKILIGIYQIWLIFLAWDYRVFTFESNLYTFLVVFMMADFTYYVQHRLMHEWKPLWALHQVHHSSPWMNFSTGLRLTWLGPIITPFFHLPMILIGFHPLLVGSAVLFNLFYQFWLHTEMIPRLGFLEGWINTPSAHRVHHATNKIYIDKNYGGILMIWDRLFGTYEPESEPVTYGVTTGFTGHNPFVNQFIGLRDLFRGKLDWKG